MVCRRGILNGLSFDVQYKIAADYDFTVRLLQHAKHVDYYPLPVCAFEKPQQKSRHDRAEQFLIRRRLKIAGPLENTALYLLQTAA